MPAVDPFFGTNPVVAAIEQHRGRLEQIKENSARLAQAYASYGTTGNGTFLVADPHLFGATFSEQPLVAYGYSLTTEEEGEEEELAVGNMPQASGGVRRWVRDARGFYIGAYVFFVIDTAAIEQQDIEGQEPPPDDPTTPPTPSSTLFSENFDRPNSALIGNGWIQAGGDFAIDTNRAITRDETSWMGQGFGRKNMSISAKLRTPNNMQPCVYAWSNSSSGAVFGYSLVMAPASQQGFNLELRKNNVPMTGGQKRITPAGTVIGNVDKVLKLQVVENIPLNVVEIKGFVDGVEHFSLTEAIANAPTGSWSGVGNSGLAGPATGGVTIDNVIMAEISSELPPAPTEPVETAEVPIYKITHDFTFTGIALKDLPEYLLEPPATA